MWPERKKRDEFWPKIWVKIVTDSQRDDVADRGRVSCGSRCIIVYSESSCAINWDNLAALVNNPSLSYFFRHLNPRTKGLYHHKCISVKASFFFFSTQCADLRFSLSFSQATKHWLVLDCLLCSWLRADKAESNEWGSSWRPLLFLLRDGFLTWNLFSKGAPESLLWRRSKWNKPHHVWRDVREMKESLKAGNWETDDKKKLTSGSVSPGRLTDQCFVKFMQRFSRVYNPYAAVKI